MNDVDMNSERSPGVRYQKGQASTKRLWIIVGAFAFLLVATIAYIGPLEVVRGIWISVTEDTEYAPGYTEIAFQKISIGDSEVSVRKALGAPLNEEGTDPSLRWLYTPHPEPVDAFGKEGEYPDVRFSFTEFSFGEDGTFIGAFGQVSHGSTSTAAGTSTSSIMMGDGANSLSLSDADIEKLKAAKATPAEIEVKFGKPQAVFDSKSVRWLKYSHSPGSKNFRQRAIGIDRAGKVCRKVGGIYWD